ncbi:MAG: DUF2442 domain-containing protein [Chitinophagaceae bacterium]
MNTSVNKYDAVENLIFEEGLKIQAIDIHQELDLLLVILNTNAILRQKISAYSRLAKATEAQIHNYHFIGGGTGIHWPDIDEDLSLKGFLQNELRSLVGNRNPKAA